MWFLGTFNIQWKLHFLSSFCWNSGNEDVHNGALWRMHSNILHIVTLVFQLLFSDYHVPEQNFHSESCTIISFRQWCHTLQDSFLLHIFAKSTWVIMPSLGSIQTIFSRSFIVVYQPIAPLAGAGAALTHDNLASQLAWRRDAPTFYCLSYSQRILWWQSHVNDIEPKHFCNVDTVAANMFHR